MNKKKMESERCYGGYGDYFCMNLDPEHILERHHRKFKPWSYFSKNKIGFHQTSFASAMKISLEGFKPGSKGMFGPGIYFAECIEHVNGKARFNGALIVAVVNPGTMKECITADSRLTLDKLRNDRNGGPYNSVYAKACPGGLSRSEFVVYEPERVIEWIICLQ